MTVSYHNVNEVKLYLKERDSVGIGVYLFFYTSLFCFLRDKSKAISYYVFVMLITIGKMFRVTVNGVVHK